MRAFGKPRSGGADPIELKEVCVSANSEVLRALARFIAECADRMDQPARDAFSHDHFLAHHPKLGRRTPDFIVGNPRSH
jgi:hypothetical protein